MAREMRTFITIVSDKKDVADKLQDLFRYSEGKHEASALDIINCIKGTDYSFSDETFKKDWRKELDFPDNDTWEELIGSKWLYVDYVHNDNPKNCNIVCSHYPKLNP